MPITNSTHAICEATAATPATPTTPTTEPTMRNTSA
jgi:hypothetical protein